jgi:putative ABC transport system ATP-binding protein
MRPYFELDDVWVHGNRQKGSRDPVAGVTLEILSGERWSVVGPSGAGKSTLLRLLNRLAEPSRGEVRSEGNRLSEIPPSRLRRQVAMVFQEPIWLPGTALDNLLAAAELNVVSRREAEGRLQEILRLTGLDPAFLGRGEDELSVGERQRVALGRALMTRPRALLLDEPTAALDPPGARALIEQIVSLCRAESLTAVMVTHRLRDARLFGTRAAVMEGGTIVDAGSSSEVLTRLERRWKEPDS